VSPARWRLIGLVLALVALYVLFWIVRPVDAAGLRRAIDDLGWVAPVVYVPVSAVLGALLVPGPALAAAAGLLFGPVLGTACSLAAAVAGSVLALAVSRAVGRDGVAEVPSPRLRAFEGLLERRALSAVVLLRLLPVLPDAPVSHAAGLLRVPVWALALGTLLGAAPRAVAYVLLGDGLGTRSTGTVAAGAGLVVLTGALGLALGAWELRRARRGSRRPTAPGAPVPRRPGAPPA
jgi:uncharacterized membrane protein YdjX (TVP38/TMEM64 family)